MNLQDHYVARVSHRVKGQVSINTLARGLRLTREIARFVLEGRGAWAVPVGRMLPFVRAFTSIVAGLVQIPAGRFGVMSLIGTVVYATVLSVTGYELGSTWQRVSHGLTIVGYILFAVVVIAIVAFIAYRWRQFRRETRGTGPGGPAGPRSHRSDAEIG